LALRGKCHGCRERISARSPIVEAAFGLAYLGLALLTQPDLTSGGELTRYGLQAAALSMLLMAALIDLDTKHLPDTLVYGAIAAGAAASLLPANLGAPEYLARPAGETIAIALAAAGALALLERYAALALRRLQAPTSGPITSDHMLLAATLAALLGPVRALAITAALVAVDARSGARLRLPQPLHLALTPALIATSHALGRHAAVAAVDALIAAGAVALTAGIAMWANDHLARNRDHAQEEATEDAALGFGDVKLAAALAALLPNPLLLALALMLASLTGTLHGIAARQRAFPFGPHLLLGCILAATIGPDIATWYANLTGVPL